MNASSEALAATSATSQIAAATPASGVFAPASKFGSERLSDPHDTYDEKNPPTMFDNPCPMNSRLGSMRWPDRTATAFATEIDWPSATMESATARPNRSGTCDHSTAGTCNGGTGEGNAPSSVTCHASPSRLSSSAASAPTITPASMKGQSRLTRRSTTATTSVTTPTITAPGWICDRCWNVKRSNAPVPWPASGPKPNRSRNAWIAISAAAPPVKPSSAAGEMKLASVPSRNAPTPNCSTPTTIVTVSARSMYEPLPGTASGAIIAKSASEFALVGPDITCQLDPNTAAIAHGTTAV